MRTYSNLWLKKADAKSEFERMLNGVVIIAGEGSLWIQDPNEKVYVAIVHDGSSYTPGGAIFIDNVGNESSALESAYEILEESDMIQNYMKELEEEFFQEFIKEDMSDEDAHEKAYDKAQEQATFDGGAWTLSAKDAYDIISKNKYAMKFVTIEVDTELNIEILKDFSKEQLENTLDKYYKKHWDSNSKMNNIEYVIWFNDENDEAFIGVHLYPSDSEYEIYAQRAEKNIDWKDTVKFDDFDDFKNEIVKSINKAISELESGNEQTVF
jgi:hypothetical protein